MKRPSDEQIDQLIASLANVETAADVCNEYAPTQPSNAIRRANLKRYLQAMAARMPPALLLMEAPGYRGCRLTGVPVTSRKILLEGLPELDLFGVEAGFRDVDERGFERIYGEQTATIVWGALADLGTAPFIWNAFPFHPHKKGQALSNRRPRKAEMRLGAQLLRPLLDLWRFRQIIAVGNVAHETLTDLGMDCVKVRHPAQGGKNDFVAGLTAIQSSLFGPSESPLVSGQDALPPASS